MARKKPQTSRQVGVQPKAQHTTDSFTNFQASVGWGANNQASGASYSLSYQSRNRLNLEAAYRGSWIVGAAVDAIPEDMTRCGIEMTGLEPNEASQMEQEMMALAIWDMLCDTGKWARLYGGAIAVMLIDGQDMATPLRVDAIGKGSFKGLLVLDRWMVSPPTGRVVTEFGPDMGKPVYYDVLAATAGLPKGRIHYSRVLRWEGADLPYFQRVSENGWGLSVLEPLWDRLIAFDSASVGAGQLVYKAHLRVLQVDKLREIIAMGGPALKGLQGQIAFTREAQTNEGMTVLDSTDKFETHQYSFGGLSDVLIQFAQQLSGALGIPLTRLFGQSPAGLNATGEGDMKQYHEKVKQQQERRLRNPLHRLLAVLSMSKLGKPLPESFGFTFNNLQEMSESEKADIATKKTTAVADALDAGLIDKATGMKELKASAGVTGLFGNIDDAAIEQAAQQEQALPLPGPELEMPDLSKLATTDSMAWLTRFLKKR